MTEQRKPKREQKIKHVLHFTGNLSCSRCAREWFVTDLNPERKVVPCLVDGEPNDIKEAIKRAA